MYFLVSAQVKMCEGHQPAGRWDQGVQGNLWSLHLPSVQTYPADLWDQALHQLPENEKHTHFNCLFVGIYYFYRYNTLSRNTEIQKYYRCI